MKFTRHHLFSIFIVLFFFVTISPIIERLEVIGKPNLSMVRMGIGILLLIITIPFIFQRGLSYNFRTIMIIGILYLFIAYILLVSAIYKEKFTEITFYIIYIHLVFFGYLAVFPENLERFGKLINILCFIAISVGLFMTIVGPDKIQAMGIGAIEGKWGQFTTTDAQTTTSIEVSLFFRSFSIFMDHQAFSVFLQLSAFFYRFLHFVKKESKYILYIAVLLAANTMTFSTTGFLVILVILLSFLKFRYTLICIPVVIIPCVCFAIAYPQISLIIFHLGSMQMRLDFVQNALQMVKVLPSLNEMWKVNFTQDCYVLWMTYKYGIIYTVLQFILLVAFVLLLIFKRKHARLPVLLLSFVYFINILTNAVCYSTPNNILLPVLFGMVAYYSIHLNQINTPNSRSVLLLLE